MPLLAAIIAVSAFAPVPQVAFTARFYYPPDDWRISHSQLYVCDLHGRTRKELTSGDHEASDVWWLGDYAVTWVDRTNAGCSLMKIDLRTSKRSALARGQEIARCDLDVPGGPLPVRGQPIYSIDGDLKRVTEKGLMDVKVARSPSDLGAGVVDQGHEIAKELTVKMSDGTSTKIYPSIVGRGGKRHELAVPGIIRRILPMADPNVGWVYSNMVAASAGSTAYVQRVDWSTGALTTLIDDLFGVDFQPNSRYWAAIDAGRPMSPYGPTKKVYTAAAWVGDVKTGKRWKVADGLVLTSSISLRP
jgi:hypothetical protein